MSQPLGAGFWRKWRLQANMLRSTLPLELPDAQLHELLEQCLVEYRSFVDDSPSIYAVLDNISGRNQTPIEVAFMWLGGWRPTSAIVLVYSKMGVEIWGTPSWPIQKLSTTHCVLSQEQLAGMETLHKHTIEAEADLSKELSTFQMLIADQNIAKALCLGQPSACLRQVNEGEAIFDIKLKELRTLFVRAEKLRLQTLQKLLHLLTPTQAVRCCIAAFELSFAMKAMGLAASVNSKRSISSIRDDLNSLSIHDAENPHDIKEMSDADAAGDRTLMEKIEQ